MEGVSRPGPSSLDFQYKVARNRSRVLSEQHTHARDVVLEVVCFQKTRLYAYLEQQLAGRGRQVTVAVLAVARTHAGRQAGRQAAIDNRAEQRRAEQSKVGKAGRAGQSLIVVTTTTAVS